MSGAKTQDRRIGRGYSIISVATASLLILAGGMASGQNSPLPVDSPKGQGTPTPRNPAPEDIIRQIRFDGLENLPEVDLRSLIKSQVGQPLDRATIKADLARLNAWGYFYSVLAFYDQPVGGRGVSLTFKITEMPDIQDVEFRGLEDDSKVTLEELEDTTGLKKGVRPDPIRAQLAIHAIRTIYQEKGYLDAVVRLVEGGKVGDLRVIIEVDQGPRTEPEPTPEPPAQAPVAEPPADAPPGVLADFVLGEVEFRGRINVGLAEIEEKTGLKKGARSDVFRIVEASDEIRKLYRHKGYEQAEATLIEGSKPGQARVIIGITEGPRTEPRPLDAPLSLAVPMDAPPSPAVSTQDADVQKSGIGNLFSREALPVEGAFGKASPKKEPAPVEVPSQLIPFPKGVIREIRIEGLQTLLETEVRAKLKSKVGENLDRVTMEADLSSFEMMKCFSNVQIYYEESSKDPGFILVVQATEMPVLQDVQIRNPEDASGITLKEIEEMTGLKSGVRADYVKFQMATHQIRTLCAEKGYNNAKVKVIEGDKAGDKRVIIEIDQGSRSEPKSNSEQQISDFGSPAITGLFDFSPFIKDSPDIKDFPVIKVANYEAEIHLKKARDFQESCKWRQVIEEASRVISLAPDVTEAYRIRSEAFCAKKLYRRAIVDWSRVIESSDVTSNDFISRGWTYAEDRDLDHALADMETALKLSGTGNGRVSALRYRGWVHLLRGELEQALADYNRVVELGPGEQIHHLELGGCLAKMGWHELAIGEFDQAIAIRPDAKTSYNRAESRFARGEYALALADYERAIEAEPGNEWYRQGRGWGLLSQGRVDQAIEEFTFAIEGDPEKRKKSWTFCNLPSGFDSKNHRAITGRGWAYLAKHDLEHAKADFEKAESLQPAGRIYFDFSFLKDLSQSPWHDQAVAEFYKRCVGAPDLGWAWIVLKEQEARSQYLEHPYFAAYLVCRTRPDSALPPSLIFRVVMDWRTVSEAKSAYLGSAIVAARQLQWKDVLDNLDSALEAMVESRSPGSTRPTFAEILKGL